MIERVDRAAGADAPAPRVDVAPATDISPLLAGVAAARGGGSPVPPEFSARFGVDFGAVRVHTDDRADELARSAGAVAFTTGTDIFFSAGAYDPAGPAGQELLGHELAHVVQHTVGGSGGESRISDPADPAEREAARIGFQASLGSVPLDVMQHAAGNRAVARAVGARTVSRWVGPEHEEIGNSVGAEVTIDGVTLTWGQIVALAGDHYGSVHELRADMSSEEGRSRLKARLEAAKVRNTTAPGLPDKGVDADSNQLELLLGNSGHFVPGAAGAGPTWEEHHATAMRTALLAGFTGEDQLWEHAKLYEAFGQHFLTDSFAAGHIRTPREESRAWYLTEFAPKVFAGLYLRFVLVQSPIVQPLLAKAAQELAELISDAVAGVVSGALHDHDNSNGLWVSSDAHPEPWRAYGDTKLADDPTSREQAALAARAAAQQLDGLRAIGAARRNAVPPAGHEWADQVLGSYSGIGAAAVQRFLPRARPGADAPQENWRWGEMSEKMVGLLDRWFEEHNAELRQGVLDLVESWDLPEAAQQPLRNATNRFFDHLRSDGVELLTTLTGVSPTAAAKADVP